MPAALIRVSALDQWVSQTLVHRPVPPPNRVLLDGTRDFSSLISSQVMLSMLHPLGTMSWGPIL